jgi:hypothetical protein
MSNNYVTSSFVLNMTVQDANMVRLAERASGIVEIMEGEDRHEAYRSLGPDFATLFPSKDGDDFGSFLDLFDDPDFPTFDCDITINEPDADGRCEVDFSGRQFGVDQVANLIYAACKSALPCAFSWAFTCDKLRADEFGGGCVIITAAGVDFHSTTGIIGQALVTAASASSPELAPKPFFDPTLVTIEPKRFSVTQGEVLVSYDGQRIEQYGDAIKLIDCDWKGYPDTVWMAVAYREAIARNLATRLPVVEEAAITAHLDFRH